MKRWNRYNRRMRPRCPDDDHPSLRLTRWYAQRFPDAYPCETTSHYRARHRASARSTSVEEEKPGYHAELAVGGAASLLAIAFMLRKSHPRFATALAVASPLAGYGLYRHMESFDPNFR